MGSVCLRKSYAVLAWENVNVGICEKKALGIGAIRSSSSCYIEIVMPSFRLQ